MVPVLLLFFCSLNVYSCFISTVIATTITVINIKMNIVIIGAPVIMIVFLSLLLLALRFLGGWVEWVLDSRQFLLLRLAQGMLGVKVPQL